LNWAQTSTFSRKHTPKIDTWEQSKAKQTKEKEKKKRRKELKPQHIPQIFV
jgi:hypothetical protein